MPGRKGKTKASVHAAFAARLQELRANALTQALAFRGEGLRPWQIPSGTSDLLDVANLHRPGFDRDTMNTNYLECMQDPANAGTTGDVISLKQQIDYNAMEERAFRVRHATICRCLTHAAVRRYGQGKSRIFDNIEKQVSDAIAAGGA